MKGVEEVDVEKDRMLELANNAKKNKRAPHDAHDNIVETLRRIANW